MLLLLFSILFGLSYPLGNFWQFKNDAFALMTHLEGSCIFFKLGESQEDAMWLLLERARKLRRGLYPSAQCA